MLVKWICLSRLQIGKDLLTVLIILLKHVKIFHFNNQKCFYYKLLLVSRFCLSLFSRKFIAFLNTVKPLKKRRGLISFLSQADEIHDQIETLKKRLKSWCFTDILFIQEVLRFEARIIYNNFVLFFSLFYFNVLASSNQQYVSAINFQSKRQSLLSDYVRLLLRLLFGVMLLYWITIVNMVLFPCTISKDFVPSKNYEIVMHPN